MNSTEFKQRGKEVADYIVNYLETVHERRVTPEVKPGYLRELLPTEAPAKPEKWEDIMADVDTKIMKGMTHWQHPRFHAYFPSGNSYPSLLGGMLGDAMGNIGFSWAANPVGTELETIVCDWMAKMVDLPKEFLSTNTGGGVIQTSASEAILDCMLAARARGIAMLRAKYGPSLKETELLDKLIGYCSKEAHSSVEKAAMISFVHLRALEPDEEGALRGDTLRKAIEHDRKNGYYPFFVSTTLGTTGATGFDNIAEIGPICEQYDAWMHVDGAYGGNCFVCPEFRPLMKGIEYASSFNLNTNKWMLTHFDCSLMWVKEKDALTQALVVDPLYLQHSHSKDAIDYRNWGVPLSRRFRALKLWFVIRKYGIEGIQEYIRLHTRLAKFFEKLVNTDKRFEVSNVVRVGLVCFRMVGPDSMSEELLENINNSGKLHMVPAACNGRFVIRMAVTAPNATEDDMVYAWKIIQEEADKVLDKMKKRGEKIPSEDPEIEVDHTSYIKSVHIVPHPSNPKYPLQLQFTNPKQDEQIKKIEIQEQKHISDAGFKKDDVHDGASCELNKYEPYNTFF